MTSEQGEPGSRPLRVGFVPGVSPDKWGRIWAERVQHVPLHLSPVDDDEQTQVLYDGRADMCFVRLSAVDERLHVIPLYRETPVVVTAKDHIVEAADEVTVADLADEHLLQDPDLVPEWRDVAVEVRNRTRVDVPPLTMRQAIETVATGAGIVIVPMSVARLHHRKDVVHRPVVDVAESQVGLAWRRDLDDERVQTFIGIVRGRSPTSSRGGAIPAPTTSQPPEKGRPGQAVPRPGPRRGAGARPRRQGGR